MSAPHTHADLNGNLPPSDRMLRVFLGHGSPMTAIEDTAYSFA